MSKSKWFCRFEIVASIFATILLLAVVVPNLAGLTSSHPDVPKITFFSHGGDFAMRMNEIDILRRGVNPYDVWTEKVAVLPYHPFTTPATAEKYEPINAYTPWEYIYAYPLAILPHNISWWLYLITMMISLAGIGFYAYMQGRRQGSVMDAFFVALVPLAALFYPIWFNYGTGNYDLLIVAALVLMAYLLNKHHDALAGFCWAFAMMKPQIALLFAIPLLCRRRFLTCVVAGSVCFVCALVASVSCGTPIVDLILQAPAASAHGFYGCGTMPYVFLKWNLLSRDTAIVIGCVLGILVCLVQTWLVHHEKDWLVFMLPAFVSSATWTYAGDYSQLMLWPFIFLIVLQLAYKPHKLRSWLWGFVALLLFSYVYAGYHMIVVFCSGILSFLVYNQDLHRILQSLDLSLVLVLSTWYLFDTYYRRNELDIGEFTKALL